MTVLEGKRGTHWTLYICFAFIAGITEKLF